MHAPHALLVVLFAAGCVADGDGGDDHAATASAETSTATSDTATETGTTVSEVSASTERADSDTGDSTRGPQQAETGASESNDTTTQGLCGEALPAIVTDIDGTLTTADAEFFSQLDDGNYDPLEREGASAMIRAYADLGYRVMYLTGRPEIWTTMVTNETAREVTERWLDEHGFPNDPTTTQLVLAPDLLNAAQAETFKAEAIMALQAEDWRFDYAYGNTIAEIAGYDSAGIGKDVTFIIGEAGGEQGTTAVVGDDWLVHIDEHLPAVPTACERSH